MRIDTQELGYQSLCPYPKHMKGINPKSYEYEYQALLILISFSSFWFQLAGTYEFVNSSCSGYLGEILIRCNNVLYVKVVEDDNMETWVEKESRLRCIANLNVFLQLILLYVYRITTTNNYINLASSLTRELFLK